MPTLNGDNGPNTLTGASAGETINGKDGADLIFGRGGIDFLFGGNQDDFLVGGAAADLLNGGSGADTASYYDAASGIAASLAAGTGTQGEAAGDILVSIENLSGSAFADTLTGDAAVNRLYGNAGNDELRGGGGKDTLDGGSRFDRLDGGAGADHLYGGADRDAAVYSGAPSGVSVSLQTGRGTGGEAKGDLLHGIEDLWGSAYDDLLTGDAQANYLFGDSGNDSLSGRGGRDHVHGAAGRDIMAGGGDLDTFFFLNLDDSGVGAATRDRITDFDPAEGDRIQLSDIDAQASSAGHQSFTFIGGVGFTGEGQLRYVHEGGNTVVKLNVAGLGGTDMEIQLDGLIDLTSASFFLA